MNLSSNLIAVAVILACAFCPSLGFPNNKVKGHEKYPKVAYFPDPKNEGSLIPAYLEGGPIATFENANSTESHIHFYLLTSNNHDHHIELFINDTDTLSNSGFIRNGSLKVFTHGFGGSYKDSFPANLAQAYLAEEANLNVVLVDWEVLAESPWYPIAAGSAKLVGDKAANLVKFLLEQNFIRSLNDVHVIGYSLGCHVAGNVGSALGGKVARVTALDPAMPFFESADDDLRIDPTDGQFVDVVHSASGYLWENGLSFYEPRGHVDFYPNNGTDQPGCEGESFGSCSHGRSVNYFTEALTSSESFPGVKCEGWEEFLAGNCDTSDSVNLGPFVPHTARGSYFLRTNSAKPYGLGEEGMNNGTLTTL